MSETYFFANVISIYEEDEWDGDWMRKYGEDERVMSIEGKIGKKTLNFQIKNNLNLYSLHS